MKRLITLFCLSLFIFSGCKSKEDKANELIKQELFKTLFDYESYEPIETKVDSAFSSIYRDPDVVELAYLIKNNMDKVDDYLSKIKSAQSTMEIWGDSYSSYSKRKYDEAFDEYTENLNLAKETMAKNNIHLQMIKDKAKVFVPEFIGWQATHKFRCKSRGGNFSLGNYLYVFDKDIKTIIYTEDLDDEDLSYIKSYINSGINYVPDED